MLPPHSVTRLPFPRRALGATLLAAAAACAPGGAPEEEPTPGVPQPTPSAAPTTTEVLLTGHDFGWQSRYAGDDGVLGSEDDVLVEGALHLPAHTDARLHLTSRDYIYFLELPFAEQKEMAAPDLLHTMRFDSGAPGRHRLPGDQMCGYAHDTLFIDLEVQPPHTFARWLEAQR